MKRRDFLKTTLASIFFMRHEKLRTFAQQAATWEDTGYTMPVLFIGHGAPLYTLDENVYNRAWLKLAQDLPRPKAVVCISAHWLTRGTYVTAMPTPRTIHDFGRMDDRLFQISYDAPGAPELATQICETLSHLHVQEDHHWGYDHGCWCVLRCMYPEADVPILQFSIDYHQKAEHHYALGQALAFLRKKGVLILCSGNLVHNLGKLKFPEHSAYDWAIEADTVFKTQLEKGDHPSLLHYEKLGRAVQLAVPTPDHYFPMLYALGLQGKKDQLSFPVEGMSYGSTSMRSVLLQDIS